MSDQLLQKYSNYVELLQNTLSKKRFKHSLNVADMAFQLATKHGGDIDKCFIAGLLHDIKKEETPAAMKSQAILNPFPLEHIEEITPALWHAPAGAYYCKKELEISDEDVLSAIRYHTAGKPQMNLTEKVVYLADLVCVDRTYPDVLLMRQLALKNLDNAMYEAMKFSMKSESEKGNFIPETTYKAYNYYLRVKKEAKA